MDLRAKPPPRSSGCAHATRAPGSVAVTAPGLLLLNRPEFLLHWLALNGLGVSIVPINPDWRAHELEYLVDHSEIVVGRLSRRAAAGPARGGGGSGARVGRDGSARRRLAAGDATARAPPVDLVDTDYRVRAALHLGDDGPPEGLRADERVFSVGWHLVHADRRHVRRAPRRRAHADPAAAHAHERARVLGDVHAVDRWLSDPARPVSPAELVAERAREPRDDRALPRCHAGHAARGRGIG